jgi:hypothetical protein
MIIEITGSPRAGKTTILKQCCKQLGPDVILFSDDLVLGYYRINFTANPLLRRLLKDALLLAIIIPHLNKYKSFIVYTANRLRKTCEPKFIKINTFRNVLLKFARFEFIRKHLKSKIVIVDEGLSHIPFNLMDYSDDEYIAQTGRYLNSTLTKIGRLLKKIAVIVIVRERSENMVYLINSRHRRINSHTPYKIDQFIAYNHLLSEEYVNSSYDYFYSKNVFRPGPNEKSKETDLFACLLKEVAGI